MVHQKLENQSIYYKSLGFAKLGIKIMKLLLELVLFLVKNFSNTSRPQTKRSSI